MTFFNVNFLAVFSKSKFCPYFFHFKKRYPCFAYPNIPSIAYVKIIYLKNFIGIKKSICHVKSKPNVQIISLSSHPYYIYCIKNKSLSIQQYKNYFFQSKKCELTFFKINLSRIEQNYFFFKGGKCYTNTPSNFIPSPISC